MPAADWPIDHRIWLDMFDLTPETTNLPDGTSHTMTRLRPKDISPSSFTATLSCLRPHRPAPKSYLEGELLMEKWNSPHPPKGRQGAAGNEQMLFLPVLEAQIHVKYIAWCMHHKVDSPPGIIVVNGKVLDVSRSNLVANPTRSPERRAKALEGSPVQPGTKVDLSRRMDALEQKLDTLTLKLDTLTQLVTAVAKAQVNLRNALDGHKE